MTTLKTWGIYKGFNIQKDPRVKWTEPVCGECGGELLPWIDWVSHGCVAYCHACKTFHLVKSVFLPSPTAHIREEIEELQSHKVQLIHIEKYLDKPEMLWELHEKIPLKAEDAKICDQYLQKLLSVDSPETILLTHLFYSLLFNSEEISQTQIKDYLEFTLLHPHYLEVFQGYTLWLGEELDIAVFLEENYRNELTDALNELWQNNKTKFSPKEFKDRIGFYVPVYISFYESREEEFIEFTGKIRKRLF